MQEGIHPYWRKAKGTTVVDNSRELEHACDSDGSERELDDVCARKTNERSTLKTKLGEAVTSRPIGGVRQNSTGREPTNRFERNQIASPNAREKNGGIESSPSGSAR
ncbi:hypothetical protein BWI75_25100 [Gloeocapsopsis sp. AAB1 = 1H9]|uniref:Uncharacterized protein n=1 Tax=Gloeocapsopsis dulcis AAB1 = 1H9 TaxID=1433147 RepID=A0A6N8G225_9CHRO|nr:hypothetical protein [Gloeocapsopsis dulcis AAB1 = 1H9]